MSIEEYAAPLVNGVVSRFEMLERPYCIIRPAGAIVLQNSPTKFDPAVKTTSNPFIPVMFVISGLIVTLPSVTRILDSETPNVAFTNGTCWLELTATKTCKDIS